MNYWLCERGPNTDGAHVWIYRGIQGYLCSRCAVRVSKADLQEATNA